MLFASAMYIVSVFSLHKHVIYNITCRLMHAALIAFLLDLSFALSLFNIFKKAVLIKSAAEARDHLYHITAP